MAQVVSYLMSINKVDFQKSKKIKLLEVWVLLLTCYSLTLTEAPHLRVSMMGQRGDTQKHTQSVTGILCRAPGNREGPFENSSGFTIKVQKQAQK